MSIQPQRMWMKAYKYRLLWVLIILALLAWALFGCGPKPPTGFTPRDLDLTPASQPATAAEATDLRIRLNAANAEIERANQRADAALAEKRSANDRTWEFFRAVAYGCGVLGMLLLIASVLPWTAAFFASFRQVALILIGAGVLFGAMPFILSNFSAWVIIPTFCAIGIYPLGLAFLDLWRKWRAIRAINYAMETSDNPLTRLKHAAASVAIQRTINPKLNKAFATGKLQLSTEGQVVETPT